MRMEEQSEYDIQRTIFEWASVQLKVYPDLEFMYATASGVRMAVGLLMKCKRAGIVKKGLPDMVLPAPRNKFHGLYIELKKDGGKPTPDQIRYIDYLKKNNYYATVCVGLDESIKLIKDYLDGGIYEHKD
jgi:hypothetical protein